MHVITVLNKIPIGPITKNTLNNLVIATVLFCAAHPASNAAAKPIDGVLCIHPQNPRYFTDNTGRAVYLTGAHTWANLVDISPSDPPAKFDFGAYLDWMTEHNYNFIRLWTWEPATWNTKANRENALHTCAPQPFARTGPGKALDGKPKFDLNKFEPAYFDRLRKRVSSACNRDIYVSVMLFEGWAMQFSQGAWQGHPFNPENNINGIDADKNKDGKGLEFHELAVPEVTRIQENYVRKIIDTVNDLDNVLYEISNENHPDSTQWQYHMIRFIKDYERTKPKQHPVGMTFQYKGGSNETLFESPADWISPNPEGGYRDNPPVADGRKIVINDTDHLWGIGGNKSWVWKSFLRGINPIFMDPYDGIVLGEEFDPKYEPVRKALSYTRTYAEKIDLIKMLPKPELSTTGYCLANPGTEYLIYNPGPDKTFTVTIKPTDFSYEWFDITQGKVISTGSINAKSQTQNFTAPISPDAVLYLKRVSK
jgi:hypothetical protein